MWADPHLDWSQRGRRQGAGAGARRFSPGQAAAALLRREMQGSHALGGARALGARGLAAACGTWTWLGASRAVGEHILLPDVGRLEDAAPYGRIRGGVGSRVCDRLCQSISTCWEARERIPAPASPMAHPPAQLHPMSRCSLCSESPAAHGLDSSADTVPVPSSSEVPVGSVPGLVADGASSGDGNTEPPKLCQPGSGPWRGTGIGEKMGASYMLPLFKQDCRYLTTRGNEVNKPEMKALS